MNEHIVKHILCFLDSDTKFHYLNYYYQQELSKTGYDEELCYKLECLYEWWEQEKREMGFLEIGLSGTDDEEQGLSGTDDEDFF